MTPEEVRLPHDPLLLDAVLAESEERTLSTKGIEHEGLFYNSPELQDLRLQNGTKLQVDVRIDRGDLSAIYVLTDKRTKYIKVPALDQTYTIGLTQWAHNVNKRFAATKLGGSGDEGWREAKRVIGDMIREQFRLQKGRTRKRMARYLDEALKRGEDVTAGRDAPATANPSKEKIAKQASSSEKPASAESKATKSKWEAPAPNPVEIAERPRKVFQTSYRKRSPTADESPDMTAKGGSNGSK